MTLSLAQVVTLCLNHTGDAHNVGRAAAISWAESRWDPAATCHNVRDPRTHRVVCGTPDATHPLLSTDRGLWQINDRWHKEVSDAQAFDPVLATSAAFRISAGFTDFGQWAAAPLLGSDPHVINVQQLAEAEAKAQLSAEKGPAPLTAATAAVGGAIVGAGGAVAGGVTGAVHGALSLTEFLATLTERATWMRVLEVLAGAAAIVAGAFLLNRSLVTQVAGTAVTNAVGGIAHKVGASSVAAGSFRPA